MIKIMYNGSVAKLQDAVARAVNKMYKLDQKICKTLRVTLVMAICIVGRQYSFAQSDVKELLNAPTASSSVKLILNPPAQNGVWYKLDRDKYPKPIQRNKLTVLVRERGEGLTVAMDFLNPLKYKIVFNNTVVADPGLKAIAERVDAIGGLTSALGAVSAGKVDAGAKAVAGMGKETLLKTKFANQLKDSIASIQAQRNGEIPVAAKYMKMVNKNKNKNKSKNKTIDTLALDADFAQYQKKLGNISDNTDDDDQRSAIAFKADSIYAPALVTWKFFLIREITDYDQNTNNYISFLPLVKSIKESSTLFYGDVQKQEIEFDKKVTETLTPIFNADILPQFMEAYKTYGKGIGDLKKLNEESKKAIVNLEGALMYFTAPDDDPLFSSLVDYTNETVAKYIQEIKQLQTTREKLVQELETLKNQISGKIPNIGANDRQENDIIIGFSPASLDSVSTAIIKITKYKPELKDGRIDFNSIDGASYQFELRVRRYTPIVLEPSGGVFYSSAKYEQYATEMQNGSLVVKRTKDAQAPVMAAAAINMIINFHHQSLAHPLIQIGVGTGKGTPSLLAGIGFKIDGLKSLCVTGGPMWTWQNRPQTFVEGSIVTGEASLKDDLKFELEGKPAMYIGLQYNF